MGIKEKRKKIQASIVHLAATSRPDLALRELELIRQTVESQIYVLNEHQAKNRKFAEAYGSDPQPNFTHPDFC